MRTLIVILLLCSTASAQSFTISGGNRSMIVSGSGPVIVKPAEVVVETKVKTRVTPRKVITKTETKTEAAYATVAPKNQDYVVVFTTRGCSPCIRMHEGPIPELRRRNVVVLEITDSAVAAQYGVTSFPVVMVARNGKQKKRWSGFVSTATLMQVIQTPEPQSQTPQTGFYDSTIYDGQPGSSHRDRQSLIDHLVSEHAQTSAQLNGLSDAALNDLHNQFHATPRVTESLLPRYINIAPYGTIDLATYSRTDRRGNACQCGMCLAIYPHQRAYREQQARLAAQPVVELDVGQQATPMDLVESGVREMHLTDADFFCDIGCGDGRWLIEASKTSGCQSVGIEYDHDLAELARAKIREAGLSDKIQVIEGDARDFDYSAVTAIACHLYDDLLSELASAGAFNSARVTVAPYHEVPGMQMNQRGGVWIAVR